MCDGGVFSVPIAMAVIGAGTAVYQGKQQAKAIGEQMQAEQSQIDAKAQVDTLQRMAEARSLRATARASAAEAAIGGNSLQAIDNDIMAQAGRDVAMIEGNRERGVAASSADAAARTRVANAEMVGGVINTAASGATSAYSNYQIKKRGDTNGKG
ncbi:MULTISPECIES: virion core protein, T7 gp14 family [Xanthomonas]|uniref:virion core protein, T7 gp14 family n=1 Tax=Xanthomonas TaxID=338 RepID=UPI00099751C9|nr:MULTISPECIES: hypothetical protein [Xanthomonas]OOW93486.1 hypothetical protein Xvtr_13415 [Xanthomonas campestris pv. vitiscarnosae]MDO7934412.1 hypothetical protein [Xanthomonas euvesicatoria pv. eucalypti]MDO7938556.1 hypothetical protein [Xanthomonas euvesicatoria pv. eucalypti]MDO7942783.1 hypothetical protein [Xanthomonas euvesicatoria pv. eucalypti]MDO7946973.1 hypothetical protein [Xanthomonas euvesicatoria pv. eucalypti]